MDAIEKPLQIPEADEETRTPDPFITSEVLYQLSYVGMLPRIVNPINRVFTVPAEHLSNGPNA